MTRGGDTISTDKAILIGMIWINGAALVGMGLPLAVVVMLAIGMGDRPLGLWAALGGLLVTGLLSVVCGWLFWSSQITRWRLWAYRRVENIAELKATAMSYSLIWPEGHFFERTEFRTPAQQEELAKLDEASVRRVAEGRLTARRSPTRAGTAVAAILYGIVLTPLCVMAPAGLLGMIGLNVAESPIFLSLLVIFPTGLAVLIYVQARRGGVSAGEAFRSMLPGWMRARNDTD